MTTNNDALREALELVEEQANDEGLWFNAATAPEGYLQAALRNLHAKVEALAASKPAENHALREALKRIEAWDECSPKFRMNYGSNGERDYYRKIASEALAASKPEPQVIVMHHDDPLLKELPDGTLVLLQRNLTSASKPEPQDDIRVCEFCGCRTNAKLRACCERGRAADSKPEPQAQAGGPKVVALALFIDGDFLDAVNPENVDLDESQYNVQLITLQSHREAMSKLHSEYLIRLHAKDLDADEKDAALDACVEALEESKGVVEGLEAKAAIWSLIGNKVRAAITKAQEARK